MGRLRLPQSGLRRAHVAEFELVLHAVRLRVAQVGLRLFEVGACRVHLGLRLAQSRALLGLQGVELRLRCF